MIEKKDNFISNTPLSSAYIHDLIDTMQYMDTPMPMIYTQPVATNVRSSIKRVAVGNTYYYSGVVEPAVTSLQTSIPDGKYLLATFDDFPELSKLSYSKEMFATLFMITNTSGDKELSSPTGHIEVTDSGIWLDIVGSLSIGGGDGIHSYKRIYWSATRCPMRDFI